MPDPLKGTAPARISRPVVLVVVVLALLLAPVPLLPPHALAELVQSVFRMGWKPAYLVTSVVLQAFFYGSLGAAAALSVERAPTAFKRLVQIMVVPPLVVGAALIIRAVKGGHFPVLANSVIPMAACLGGAALALGIRYRGWKLPVATALVLAATATWVVLGRAPAELSADTAATLRRLVQAGSSLPPGDARFSAIMQLALSPSSEGAASKLTAVRQNRAAIVALGITLGHERLARFVGLKRDEDLVRRAVALRQGTTLRGRADWARHYSLSAALAVLEHPVVSDAGGLLKEELDAVTGGTGFSFGDLAADLAGVHFAEVATRSEQDAAAIQDRVMRGFVIDEFFPSVSDLPEGMSPEQFRQSYGAVGSARYRDAVREIEERTSRCPGIQAVAR